LELYLAFYNATALTSYEKFMICLRSVIFVTVTPTVAHYVYTAFTDERTDTTPPVIIQNKSVFINSITSDVKGTRCREWLNEKVVAPLTKNDSNFVFTTDLDYALFVLVKSCPTTTN